MGLRSFGPYSRIKSGGSTGHKMERIYLDVCCYNRPFDARSQARIHFEAEAVLIILRDRIMGRMVYNPVEWLVGDLIMSTEIMTPEQLRRAGWEALVDRLGPVDAARFLQLYDPGAGDYTLERRSRLDHLTLEEIFETVERTRGSK